MNSISDLCTQLKAHPNVAGLIEYGSRSAVSTADHHSDSGDYDLIAILTTPVSPITSLHFDVGTTPVDLSLLALKELQILEAGSTFEAIVIGTGRVIYDPTGAVQAAQTRLTNLVTALPPDQLSPHDIAFIRHGHRHLLDKLNGRLTSDPTLCHMLLNTNIYWLLETYFRVRYHPFEGIKAALSYIQHQDSTLYELIEQFYRTTDLTDQVQLTEEITAHVLAPVGGIWRKGEILAFGETNCQDLADQGEAVYQFLFLSKVPRKF